MRDVKTEVQQGAQQARGKSMPFMWTVFEDYEIVDGTIFERGKQKELYHPITCLELPNALTRVRQGDDKTTMRFVKQYGLLGYNSLFMENKRIPSEPLEWFWVHAATVRFLSQITAYLEEENTSKLKTYLNEHLQLIEPETFLKEKLLDTPIKRETSLIIGSREKIGRKLYSKHHDVVWQAREIRRDIINSNISHIYPVLVDYEDYEQQSYGFKGLIEVVYWLLADGISRKKRLMQCPACEGFFWQTTAAQQFCPPSPKSNKRESPCAVRYRARKRRAKAKQIQEAGL